jgi:autotransporter family porin
MVWMDVALRWLVAGGARGAGRMAMGKSQRSWGRLIALYGAGVVVVLAGVVGTGSLPGAPWAASADQVTSQMALSEPAGALAARRISTAAVTATPTARPTRVPTATAMPAAPSPTSGVSGVLPPGSPLPSGATCAQRVRRSSWEPRLDNTGANQTTGHPIRADQLAGDPAEAYATRVDGNFTGTTDEIIQWAACKWGFDADSVRAQAVQESSWHQSWLGDCRYTTQAVTHGCASVGLLQVKAADLPPTFPGAWPDAYLSTAFNVDFALAVRRACFDGKVTWLGNGYHAGDEWGCIGEWFAGAWYTPGARDYIAKVKAILAARTWQT